MLQLTLQFRSYVVNAKWSAFKIVITPLVNMVTTPAFTRLAKKCFIILSLKARMSAGTNLPLGVSTIGVQVHRECLNIIDTEGNILKQSPPKVGSRARAADHPTHLSVVRRAREG